MLLLWTCLFGSFTAAVFGAATRLPPTPPFKQCEWNGKYYAPGSAFSPSPCEFCQCSPDGTPMCAIADCAPTQCVDSVHDPTKCCAVCPNGPNCEYNGHVIKQGEIYQPNNDTFCSCPVGFHFGRSQAMCAVRATLPPIPVPTDLLVS